MFSRSSRCVVI